MHSINYSVQFFCLLFISKTINGIQVTLPGLGIVEGSTASTAWTNRVIYQFLGVKFGKAPSGNLRFMPPQPVEPWEGVYNATVNGIACPQFRFFLDLIRAPPNVDMEDCLLLNVFTPKIPCHRNQSELLPVMVFIHGGAFFDGCAQPYPPNYILEQDVILVVLQYRLGPLGFLCLHTDGTPGNVGFMDQVLGLEWVQKYIKYFGGDNTQVTVMGKSVGAYSISLHLLSPMVNSSLFQQAIIMSGSVHAAWGYNPEPIETAKNLYRVLKNVTNVDVDLSTMETAFKTATLIDLIRAIVKIVVSSPLVMNRVASAVVQKAGSVKYLSEPPSELIKSGKFRTVPMMIGVNKNEGSFVTASIYDYFEIYNLLDNYEFMRNNLTSFLLNFSGINDTSNFLVDTFNNIYFKKVFEEKEYITFRDVAPGITDIVGDAMFKAPTLKEAKINAQFDNKTYFYTFDYDGEYTRFGYLESNISKFPFSGGVYHTDDLLYLYPYPYTSPLNEEDTNIAIMMTELWTGFSIYGEPKSSLLNIEWPPIEKYENGPYLHIDSMPYISEDFVREEYTITSKESNSICHT